MPAEFRNCEPPSEVQASTSLEHARELALAAAGRGDVIVAFGGDGMVGALAGVVAQAGGMYSGDDCAPAQTGRINMLGVGSLERLPQAPQVPTIAETGLPGYEAVSWVGLFTASGTPRAIVTKINADVQRILADPAFRDRFLDPQMLDPMPGSPDAFAAAIKSETQKWVKVIREQNLHID